MDFEIGKLMEAGRSRRSSSTIYFIEDGAAVQG